MYNLKTTTLNQSFYHFVPALLFVWGIPLLFYLRLFPIPFLYGAITISILLSIMLVLFWRNSRPLGVLSIVANNATLTVADKTYLVEFEGFNSWRLTARLIHQETSEEQGLSLPFLWRRIPKMLLFTKLLFTKRSRYIGIYYSTLDAKSYAYLRSFAAYQCFTKSRG